MRRRSTMGFASIEVRSSACCNSKATNTVYTLASARSVAPNCSYACGPCTRSHNRERPMKSMLGCKSDECQYCMSHSGGKRVELSGMCTWSSSTITASTPLLTSSSARFKSGGLVRTVAVAIRTAIPVACSPAGLLQLTLHSTAAQHLISASMQKLDQSTATESSPLIGRASAQAFRGGL